MRIAALFALFLATAAAATAAVPPLPDDLKPAVWKMQPELRKSLDKFETLRDEESFRDYLGDLETLLAKHPDWIDLHRHYIGVARLLDDWARIQPQYKEKADKDTTNADAQYLAGIFERTAAIDYFRRALRHDPKHYHAKCALAVALLSSTPPNQDEAFPLILEAVRQRPDHPYGYQTLALAYEAAQDWETGLKVRKMSEIVEPTSFQPIMYEVRDLEQAGRPDEAVQVVEQFVRAHPDNLPARKSLIDVYRRHNRPDDAARAQIEMAQVSKDGEEAFEAAKVVIASDKAGAIDWLRTASKRGYGNYREAEREPSFAVLKGDPEFDSILAEFKVHHEKKAPSRRTKVLSKLVNKPAPPFEVLTLDSTRVSLAGLKGKVVVLDFWATWCGPCRMTLPLVKELHAAMKDRPVQILCMNVWERDPSRARVAPYWKENSYPMTVGLASAADAQAYGVTGVPTLFVLDQEGQVRFSHVGYSPYMDEEVGWVIDSLLSGGANQRGENLR